MTSRQGFGAFFMEYTVYKNIYPPGTQLAILSVQSNQR